MNQANRYEEIVYCLENICETLPIFSQGAVMGIYNVLVTCSI
jgi:hypothetical protein